MLRFILLASLTAAGAGCADIDEEIVDSDRAPLATRANGAETGAFLRETTPAGYGCIESTFALPDYREDVRAEGAPWVYFGVSDERGSDAEIGFSFQPGDGSARKPRRWLPYVRRGKTFWFADPDEALLPGDTTSLLVRLVGDRLHWKSNGRPLAFRKGDESVWSLQLPGIDPARAHFRRVVGQALSKSYDGRALATLGPVEMTGTTVCEPGGAVMPFAGRHASWSENRRGVVFGTATWPARAASRTNDHGRETVWLFR